MKIVLCPTERFIVFNDVGGKCYVVLLYKKIEIDRRKEFKVHTCNMLEAKAKEKRRRKVLRNFGFRVCVRGCCVGH